MTHEEVVDAFYAGLFAGDPEAALAHCSDDAQYHPLFASGAVPGWRWGPGSLPMRTYVTEIIPDFLATTEGYAVTDRARDVHGSLLVTRLRSTKGSGVMVFRVEDEKLTDLWVIGDRGRGADPTF